MNHSARWLARTAVATGTTSYTVVNAEVGQPRVYTSLDDAVKALAKEPRDAAKS